MTQDIPASEIYNWYQGVYKSLNKGGEFNILEVVTKLLEESIEVCIAAGYDGNKIEAMCARFIAKEVAKPTYRSGIDANDLLEELVDVGIVWKTLVGHPDLFEKVCLIEKEKHRLNSQIRVWRVNENGSLSHVKGQVRGIE